MTIGIIVMVWCVLYTASTGYALWRCNAKRHAQDNHPTSLLVRKPAPDGTDQNLP